VRSLQHGLSRRGTTQLSDRQRISTRSKLLMTSKDIEVAHGYRLCILESLAARSRDKSLGFKLEPFGIGRARRSVNRFELHFVWRVIGIPRLLMMGQSGISYYESAGIRSTHALEVGLVLNGCI